MNIIYTCLSAFMDRLLMPSLFWEKRYYQYKEGKSWVEEAIIEANQKRIKKNRVSGKEAIKVYHLLIYGSRLPLSRKIRTCGKSACLFVPCREGRKGLRGRFNREVKQVFPATWASEESSEPQEAVPIEAQIIGSHTFQPALVQRSDTSAITSQTSSVSLSL